MKNRKILQTSILFLFILVSCSLALPALSTGTIVFIQAQANNSYISIDPASTQLRVNIPNVKTEYFRVIVHSNGTYSFQSIRNNLYVSADYSLSLPYLVANRTAMYEWEKFKIIDLGGNSFALQSYNGTYVCADISLQNLPLVANRTSIQLWEKFNLFIAPFGVCAVTMKNYNDNPYEWRDLAYDVHSDGASFITSLRNTFYGSGPFESYHVMDNNNTPQFWASSITNNYDFFFYQGHGSVGTIPLWATLINDWWRTRIHFSTTEYVSATQPNLTCSYFGGKTKWALFTGCEMLGYGLNYPPVSDFLPSFQGIHAMVGYGSLATMFPGGCKYISFWDWINGFSCTEVYESTKSQYANFINNWKYYNETFWNAWIISVNRVYTSNLPDSRDQGGHFPTSGWPGIQATGIGVRGVINTTGTPKLYYGLDDKFKTAPSISTPMNNSPNWYPGAGLIPGPFGPVIAPPFPGNDRRLERRDVIYNSPIYETMMPGSITQALLANSKVTISLDKKVKQFIDTLKLGVFRSGLINQNPDELFWLQNIAQMPDFDNEQTAKPVSEACFQEWNAVNDGEFEIIYGPPRSVQLASIKKLASLYGLTLYNFDSTISENRFSNAIDPRIIEDKILNGPTVDEAQTVEKLKTIGAKILFTFRGKIEFAGVDIEYVQGKVTFITLKYRRLFRHGIIGAGTSYIHIKMGAEETPLSLCIKWPSFSAISRNEPAVPIRYAFDRVVQVFAQSDTAQKSNNYFEVSSYTINGAALAWKTVVRGKSIIITPGYFFTAKALLSDGTTAYNSLDAPRLKKYYLK